MAGESAEVSARRMREKALRLNRAATRYERGAEGERRTAHALAALPPDEWRVFHDIAWPGRRFANIDHVVIGPPGAFVIDTKNWSGAITVHGGVLRQDGRRRESAVLAAGEAAASIKRLVVAIQDLPVHAVLCFTGEQEVFGLAGDALLCSTGNLATVLTTRPVVIAPAVREDVARQLAEKLGDAATVRNVVPAARSGIFLPKPSRLASPPPRAKGRLAKADVASLLAGISLALGSIALLAADPDTLGNFGQSFVDLVSNGDESSDNPERQPGIQMPTGYVPEDQRGE
jgi:hypothetical protein